ncbi:MAG: hypothetical protein US86_C0005G0036 [Candidatus Daviesbacteria bacterium GW2011_GWA2_38_24]|uniref:Uncharacterized protein n=1 Tax=Candidatus Daviesbacteria bacterium GW2011_GWA2_38_24 TaxID=1618422 RepID=A0A0G0JTR3_9BACT|nr:MAG: hypothetical protein US86_C0005G0036 [Candidatus Daviesbacteria bacterium GW2011_GWA2_38_24]OGE22577.1 MAG: hypothetical protein A2688_03925 [Candidatus Daviesbacteria bacterium RIFCSPHIGHO2_01_FULL_38_8]
MFILTTIVTTLVLFSTVLIVSGSVLFKSNSSYSLETVQALNLAEAGVDKAVATLNKTGGNYAGEDETSLGIGSYSVKITSIDSGTKYVEATGYIPNKQTSKAKKTVRVKVSKGTGTAFSYALQVGNGGLYLKNSSRINGTVYSNGNIVMENSAVITGDAYVAGGTQGIADQESDCVAPNCGDFIFGKSVSGQNIFDVAQSFKPTTTQSINKVALKLKKIGTPNDIQVRILADNNGSPNKDSVLTQGTLYANLVTTQYSFVEVAFQTSPTLTAETTYWILLDTCGDNTNCGNSTNYWSWSQDLSQGYNRGAAVWTTKWNQNNASWNAVLADLNFKTFMGGVATYIQGGNTSQINGSAYANTLNTLNVGQGAYFQVQQNVNAASYYPGSSDPVSKVMPISDANINDWKNEAENAGVYNGNVSGCVSTLGSGKYIGNVSLINNCVTTVTTPIWITGSLTLDNGSQMKLPSSMEDLSGIVIVDGKIKLANNGKFVGSGTQGSFFTAVSMFDTTNDPVNYAIEADNGSDSMILYAGKGAIRIANNGVLTELVGWKIELSNNAVISYHSGLAGVFYPSSPSGAFSVIKGSYQLK